MSPARHLRYFRASVVDICFREVTTPAMDAMPAIGCVLAAYSAMHYRHDTSHRPRPLARRRQNADIGRSADYCDTHHFEGLVYKRKAFTTAR